MVPGSWRLYVSALVCLATILLVAVGRHAADLWVAVKYQPQIKFEDATWQTAYLAVQLSKRQQMIRDLVTNVLPRKDRGELETLLGKSPSHEEMRRYTQADLQEREKDENGKWKPFPRTGTGQYFDDLEWDLIYPIGREQILIYDHRGRELSPDQEYLIIRLDDGGRFESWYVEGSTRWRRVVGDKALQNFRRTRRGNAS
jgi:hypothetical protein